MASQREVFFFLIAHVYGLKEAEFTHILSTFPLVAESVKAAALAEYRRVG